MQLTREKKLIKKHETVNLINEKATYGKFFFFNNV